MTGSGRTGAGATGPVVTGGSRTATRLRSVVARVDRLLARDVVGDGLTGTQFSVLGALARSGELRLADLVERERVHPTMLSRVVGRLAEAGWVTRTPDPQDGRAALLTVTDAGRAVHQRLQEERARQIDEYLDGLPAADRERVVAALPVLEGLAEHLQQAPAQPTGAVRR